MTWFNADDVPEPERNTSYNPIPEGIYTVMVSKVQDKETKKGGKMLSLGMEVVDGQHKGRWIWENINYVNSNATAQLIGEQTLKAICEEIGRPRLGSPDELVGVPFKIKVKITRNDFKDELENVMSYVVQGKKAKKEVPAAEVFPDQEASTSDEDIPF